MTLPPELTAWWGAGYSSTLGNSRGSTSSTAEDLAIVPHQEVTVHTYRPRSPTTKGLMVSRDPDTNAVVGSISSLTFSQTRVTVLMSLSSPVTSHSSSAVPPCARVCLLGVTLSQISYFF